MRIARPHRSGSPDLDRYLLEGERLVLAVHQHWGKVAESVASAVAAVVVAVWLDVSLPDRLGAVGTVVWLAATALAFRAFWTVYERGRDWFVVTDKRLLMIKGWYTRDVPMMPLVKVTDMSYKRSLPGRIFGYGRFVMESAGQDQAMREIEWVPNPDHTYRVIISVIFGVGGGETPAADEVDPPYAGWRDPARAESIYRSEDVEARERAADTGPIRVLSLIHI